MSNTPYKGMPIYYRIGDGWFKAKVTEVYQDNFLHTQGMFTYELKKISLKGYDWLPRSTFFSRLFNKD